MKVWIKGALGSLALVCLTVVGAAVPASAADSTEGTDLPTVTSWQGPSSHQTAVGDVITCIPNVEYPHNSSHVNGTVNVVVTIGCTKVVPEISIRAALYFNGLLGAESTGHNVFGNNFAQDNAAVPCQNGTYQGWMSYVVFFPPGYTPPTGSSSGFGAAVTITC